MPSNTAQRIHVMFTYIRQAADILLADFCYLQVSISVSLAMLMCYTLKFKI